MGTLIFIKCTNFDPYIMAMHVRTEGNKFVFLWKNLRLLLTLFESKPHIIIIFHLKTNKQKLEKHHVNGPQTRIVACGQCDLKINIHGLQALLKYCNTKTLYFINLAAILDVILNF